MTLINWVSDPLIKSNAKALNLHNLCPESNVFYVLVSTDQSQNLKKFAGPLAQGRVRSAPGPQAPEACLSPFELFLFVYNFLYFLYLYICIHINKSIYIRIYLILIDKSIYNGVMGQSPGKRQNGIIHIFPCLASLESS